MFTIHHGIFTSFLDLFHNYNCNFYSLQSQSDSQIPRIKSVRYFGPVIWKNIPIEIRTIQNVDSFKTEITNWKP